MKKSKNKFYILLAAIATVLWFVGSWWHYSCNIKNTCDNNSPLLATTEAKKGNQSNPSSIVHTHQVVDTDSDGLSDKEEEILGTDSLLIDTDEDGIPDNEEIGAFIATPLDTDADGVIDALDYDDDNDGLSTAIEEKIGTSSLRQDTDDDGINDFKEVGTNHNKPTDTDNDGIINALDTDDDDDSISTSNELLLGTNSLLLDTDGDGLSDAKEIGKNINTPLDTDQDGVIDAIDTDEEKDQDGDGLIDSVEARLNTDPTKPDTDGDGVNDAIEVGANLDNPLDTDLDGIIDAIDIVDDSDSDNDTISDDIESKLGSNPRKEDSDNDGINDNEEIGKNINDPLDTDADGILNINDKDDDNDKLSTRYEIRIGTNPLSDDSDNDGLKDNIEVRSPESDTLQDTDSDNLINPVDPDDDNDGIPTSIEIAFSTNPLKADSDNDGKSDTEEYGSNYQIPLDSDNNGIIDALQSADKIVKAASPITPSSLNNNKEEISLKENKSEKLSLEFMNSDSSAGINAARIYFPFLSAKPEYSDDIPRYIQGIVNWMIKSPENGIVLTGHTDNIGSKKANLALGIKRVMVIRELFLDKGAPMKQIDIISRGESAPIAENKHESGRLKNRRVEITFPKESKIN